MVSLELVSQGVVSRVMASGPGGLEKAGGGEGGWGLEWFPVSRGERTGWQGAGEL